MEVTTEGGLNLKKNNLRQIIKKLKSSKIEVSLFVDPSISNIKLAKKLGARYFCRDTYRQICKTI